jgi:RNA polymerase sigma-70 factor, ECF subfamily
LVSLSLGEDDEGDEIRLDPADDRRDPAGDLANRELARALSREIDRLQPSYRELVVLRHLVGLSYNEIAELKNLPLGTVKNKLFRAHSVLRETLEPFLAGVGAKG